MSRITCHCVDSAVSFVFLNHNAPDILSFCAANNEYWCQCECAARWPTFPLTRKSFYFHYNAGRRCFAELLKPVGSFASRTCVIFNRFRACHAITVAVECECELTGGNLRRDVTQEIYSFCGWPAFNLTTWVLTYENWKMTLCHEID